MRTPAGKAAACGARAVIARRGSWKAARDRSRARCISSCGLILYPNRRSRMKVLSSLAIKEAYLELAPAFEAKSGKKLDTSWLGMVDIRKRMQSGESADVVIGSAALLAELKSPGNIASIVPLAKSGVAVAVRKGAKHPDLSSGEAVKRGLRAAKSIAYSSGPSGVYLSQLFE